MQNFGQIKNAFNNLLIEAVVSNNSKNKQLFKNYVKTIKENKILKTQFLIYNNIETKVEKNEFKANLFLQENLNLLNKFSKKEILEANNMLASKLSEIPDVIENKELYENINTLIFSERTSNNIDKIVESTANIVNFITKNVEKQKEEPIEVPPSMLTSIMVEKYNSKYSTLDDYEFNIVKQLIESDDEGKTKIYENTKRDCIDLVNEQLLVESISLDTKDKLLKVKDKLLNDKLDINEDYLTKISNLVELKNSLK